MGGTRGPQSGQWPPISTSDAIPSYEGYEYLGDNLASHGNFVVSISTNGINALDNDSPDLGAGPSRADPAHLDILRDLDTTGSRYSLRHIALWHRVRGQG